ncbi:MAG: BON domain-containing protein [Bryobacteraceae bacterium]|nr:BON domain-containing protein [Bryobacteraceae bacterium]
MRLFTLLFVLLVTLLPALSKEPVSDDHLYDQVRIRMANDREIGGNAIEVKVTEGVVEISGKVRSDRQKDRAEKITRKVKGVKSVVNKLTVAPV